MFEKKSSPTSPVEDILAGTDKEKTPPPSTSSSPSPPSIPEYSGKAKVTRKIMVILGIIFGILIVGGLGFLSYKKFQKTTPLNQNQKLNKNINQNLNKYLNNQVPGETPPPAQLVNLNIELPAPCLDNDGDGLCNEEEKELKTKIDNPDSDGDELSDLVEVKIYQTDPLDPDTDNDGYLDGEEVKAGYNPKGSGKLLDLEKELKNLQK